MKSRIALLFLIAATAAAAIIFLNRKASTKEANEASQQSRKSAPVLVELFTSEGCSSCPPADEVLTRLEQTQPVEGAQIITLSEHVDYWNRLGWADPYSSAQFSERQSQYAASFGSDQIYTPQMVVDGRAEFVGSNTEKARSTIAGSTANPKATVTVNLLQESAPAKSDDARLKIVVENMPAVSDGDTAEVLLAIAESGLRSSVARGENAGRKLTHISVVRSLTIIGNFDSSKGAFGMEARARIEREWKQENLKAVVFVQERASRRVLGAAAISIARE